jgi:hypothetical protein
MVALQVDVNGERACLAGVGAKGGMHVLIDWADSPHSDSETSLSVSGFDSSTGEYLHWGVPPVCMGTEILVRFVDVAIVDPPTKRYQLQGQSVIEEIREHLDDLTERTIAEECEELLRELIRRLEST